jgi:hypothetical protein
MSQIQQFNDEDDVARTVSDKVHNMRLLYLLFS